MSANLLAHVKRIAQNSCSLRSSWIRTAIAACAAASFIPCALALAAGPAPAAPAAPAAAAPTTGAPATAAPADSGTPKESQPGVSSEAARRQFDDAVALHKGGAYELAVDEWEKFLKNFPDDPMASQAQFFAGVCYLSMKDKQYDKARDAFQKVVTKYPKFEQLDKAYFNLGLSAYNLAEAGNAAMRAQAADAFGQLIEKFPKSPQVSEALLYRGESLYAMGKKDEAVKAWSDLATNHADSPLRARALYNLGIAQSELGQQEQAGATFAEFLKAFPKNDLAAEVTMRKADTQLITGKLADAEKEFAAAAAKPDYPLADYATLREGAAMAGQKKYAEAAAVYASLPTKFPKSSFIPAATLAAGNCYYLAGNQAEARNWLGKVLAGGGAQGLESAHWIARSWLKDKNPTEALAVVEKALPAAEGSPRRADLLMDQADALYDLPNRRGESAAIYAKLAKDFPNDSQAAQAQYMAASAALAAADYPGAWTYTEAFLKAHPKHALEPDVRFIAAEAQLLSGQHPVAEQLYTDLLTSAPDHADAGQWLVRRALAQYLQKKYAEVVAGLKPALAKLKSPERQAEAQFLLGSSYLELKQYPEAAEALQKSLAAAPHAAAADEALLALAAAQQATRDTAGAMATLKKLVADFPQSKLLDRAHFRLGEMVFATGDYAGAATEYQWVLDHGAGGSLAAPAQAGLAWTQLNRSDYATADKSFTSLIKDHADSPLAVRARYGRAAARQQLKNYAGAAEDIEAYLKSEPKSAQRSDALYVLGLAQEGSKKYAEAATTLAGLLTADPKYAAADKVLYELAWSRKSAGDDPGAIEAFTRLAKDHGDSPLAAESWFNVGEAAYQKKDYKGASEAYSAAVSKGAQGDLGEKTLHKLGWAEFQLHDYAKAHDALAKQLQAYPQGPLAADAAFLGAECLFKQEKYADALAEFQQALATGADHKPSSPEFLALTLLHGAQAADQLKKFDVALPLLTRFAKEMPDSPHQLEATFEQAWADQQLGKGAKALELYTTVADKTDGVVGARARFMIGEILFEQGNHKEAIRNYFKVAYGYGDTQAPEPYHLWQASALFEAGRCFEVLKSVEQAKKMYNDLLSRYPNSDKVAAAKERLKALGG
jgi:TolA-binding protein